jgi:hypothetical protein
MCGRVYLCIGGPLNTKNVEHGHGLAHYMFQIWVYSNLLQNNYNFYRLLELRIFIVNFVQTWRSVVGTADTDLNLNV